MRTPIRLPVRSESGKIHYEDCMVWTDECPPEYLRGKNKRDKTRRGKRLRDQPSNEE